jgi:hypothetical protein
MAKIEFWKLISGREVGLGSWNETCKNGLSGRSFPSSHDDINWKFPLPPTSKRISLRRKCYTIVTIQMLFVCNLSTLCQLQRLLCWRISTFCELQCLVTEDVVMIFEVPMQYSRGGTEENHWNPFEQRTSGLHDRSVIVGPRQSRWLVRSSVI